MESIRVQWVVDGESIITLNTSFSNQVWDAIKELILDREDGFMIQKDKELISGMFDVNARYHDSLD
jgi:hypothetical protein